MFFATIKNASRLTLKLSLVARDVMTEAYHHIFTEIGESRANPIKTKSYVLTFTEVGHEVVI